MKRIAERIFRETLAAIDIPATLARKLKRKGSSVHMGGDIVDSRELDLRKFREIVAFAFGKVAFAMADGLSAILAPEFRPEGILVVPTEPSRELPGWKAFVGGHPVPTEESFEAGRAILERLKKCDERSLIVFLISGGGSSLVEQPLDPGITLRDFQDLNAALVTCGGSIEEINAIRKHLSAIKGGRLALAAPRSMKLTLAVSDVPEGRESALASGPTLPDPTTIADAERIVAKYHLLEKFPPSVCAAFESHKLQETPKADDPAFARASFTVLLNEHDLFHAAHRTCEAEGYVCLCDNSTDNWPIEKAASHLLAGLESFQKENPGRPVAILADGEVSSPVTGNGIGGRNSAFVLACASKIAGRKITVLSAGTDGVDGNSSAAGAVADGETMSRAKAAGIDSVDFMRRSDAYNYFARLGDTIMTGPTGNNLRDLRIFLSSPQ